MGQGLPVTRHLSSETLELEASLDSHWGELATTRTELTTFQAEIEHLTYRQKEETARVASMSSDGFD